MTASESVSRVVAALTAVSSPDETALVIRFAELFLADATPELFVERSPDTIAALVLSAFRHLQHATPDGVDVTVVLPEEEPEPWHADVTVIRTRLAEAPFIVGSIREYLHGREFQVERFLYPVMQVVRSADGAIEAIGPASAGTPLESVVHCEVAGVQEVAVIEEVRAELRSSLEDLVAVTTDFPSMKVALNAAVASLGGAAGGLPGREAEAREVQEFLRWLRHNFVFLGYSETGDVGTSGAGTAPQRQHFGLARQPGWSGRIRRATESQLPTAGVAPLPNEDRPRWPPRLLVVTQTDAESTVHRRERMHDIALRTLGEQDRILGERHFLGLFRARAYQEKAANIPILRHKLALILKDAGWRKQSHNYREAIKIFNSMPKEELFLGRAVDIGREIQAILAQYYTGRVSVTLRPDPAGRTVSAMVIMPRDRYSGRARRGIQNEFIQELDATLLNTSLVMGGGEQARLHFQLAAPAERIRSVTAEQLVPRVQALIQTWTDALEMRLLRDRAAETARRQARRWGAAFSQEYQASTEPEQAVADLEAIEAMEATDRSADLRLSNPESVDGERVTLLTVYMRRTQLVLSDVMPGLENAGLRVLSMSAFEAREEAHTTFIHVFALQDAARQPIDLQARGPALAEALLAVGAGEATSDSLNELVLRAGLAWREVDVLRLYCEYAFQLGLAPARSALTGALRSQPTLARLLITMFSRKFDPAITSDRIEREAALHTLTGEFMAALAGVTSLAQDRALRSLLKLLHATVRTNYFLHGGAHPTTRSGGVPYISIKILNERLEAPTDTRLRAEVWVQSARMAGVHLRGGPVSRGGLRHSDRPDDLRTEVHGLVRTQSVKNCVIVPAGSKGGFVTRQQPSDPTRAAAEVAAQYQTLIRGLLDVTDNLAEGGVVRPDRLIVHDAADPYLVVAADKGTARFSDVANEVADEYGFWLGDAFASGGSNGYNHKDVGITARGAWESVRRHFKELGVDVQTEPVTVVGIGDMSGDVFGNGMLLSPEIRLVAAFDHRHIFVDPTPEAAATFAERQRLFALSTSSWADYDESLLSEGGFIVPRGIKEIELPPAAATALGVPDDKRHMDGETLVRTILCAPVDLLWNGGIGTYVKASTERHADIGDSANDAVRVDATHLRCRVLGEGGNLGLTQHARVEFALNGGRCNTDAIDNAGGVDMSDREVNLKILLNAAIASGRLDPAGRNALLHALTDDITAKVLSDNRSQSLAISLDLQRASDGFEDHHGFMVDLERKGVIRRAGEALPTLEDLRDRSARSQSLTRPELAVLLAYAKLTLKPEIVTAGLVEDPALEGYLIDYFPTAAAQAAGPDALAEHRLRAEIIVTQLANEMVDLMGATFVYRVTRDTGRSAAEVAHAWFIAARLSGAPELHDGLLALEDRLPSEVIYRWLLGLSRVLERTTRWILANVSATVPAAEVIRRYLDGLRELRGDFRALVVGADRELFESRLAEARELTEREDVAESIITLRFFDQLMEILTVAGATGRPAARVGRSYFQVSELLGASRLREAFAAAAGDSRWEQRVAQALDEELGRAHRALTSAVVTAGSEGEPIDDLLARIVTRHASALAAFRAVMNDVASDERPSLAALTIAVRELAAIGGNGPR